ncbi:MAG: hypothetical protein HY297_00150 [Thaumarchaeota archaeon]|nr:hypothetical protein [Nitrososphaerota archaeon]
MPSGRIAVLAGILVAVVVAASFGTYFLTNLSRQSRPVEQLSVYKNQILIVGSFGTQGQPKAYQGIWQMEIGNNGQTRVLVDLGLYTNGAPSTFNNTAINPGQKINVTDCRAMRSTAAPSVVKIFASSQSGVITPEYPVTVVNATAFPFSNQFNASSQLRLSLNQSTGIYSARWNVSVMNTGNKPITYLSASLANDTGFLSSYGMRCAGGVGLGPLFVDYTQALQPGQTALEPYPTLAEEITLGHAFGPGKSYSVTITAAYPDDTVVTLSFPVTATG